MFFIILFFQSFVFAQTPTEFLKDLVNINSGSENISGVNSVTKYYAKKLTELGFKNEWVKNTIDPNKAPLLKSIFSGATNETITFIMHADTVFEPSSGFLNFEIKDQIATGPGVIDDKGGMVVGYFALKDFLAKNSKPKYTFQFIITPSEEIGAPGFDNLFKEWAKTTWMVLGLEPSHEKGIVSSRKGNRWIQIKVQGKEAHAGRHHQDGINACDILAEKLIALKNLTNYAQGVTVSVGRIEGGQDKFNIVCGQASAKVDTRSPSLKARETLAKKIDTILKHPAITYEVVDDTLPYSVDQKSRPFIQRYLSIIEKVEGIKAKDHSSGGTGDTNYFSREGIVIMDGLGPIGDEIHTNKEWIDLKSLESRATILSHFLQTL